MLLFILHNDDNRFAACEPCTCYSGALFPQSDARVAIAGSLRADNGRPIHCNAKPKRNNYMEKYRSFSELRRAATPAHTHKHLIFLAQRLATFKYLLSSKSSSMSSTIFTLVLGLRLSILALRSASDRVFMSSGRVMIFLGS